jgi:hypothetical protein
MPVTRGWLVVVVGAALAIGACRKTTDSLLLLDVRASGALSEPVASLRFSVPDRAGVGWPVRTVPGDLGSGGVKFGYYIPGGAGPVTVLAEALDDGGCVLGNGTATVQATPPGGTSLPTTLFVRPISSTACLPPPPPPDGGAGDAASDGGADGATPDGATPDGGEAGAPPADGGADGQSAGDGGDALSPGDAAPDVPVDADTDVPVGGSDAGSGG